MAGANISRLIRLIGSNTHEILENHRRQPQESRWSLGWVSALDIEGRTIWIPDANRRDGKRYIVRSDEKLTAFWNRKGQVQGCTM